ncbi:hypothetical protein JOF53_005114 [Crossiella equi]|uniref:Uncharacterized protein n=1 Tax=Crossiella equi TaxID=130796 RepID=A0ABS5AI47_9PSEU|nr:hypothetical protein [Crossiella equi]MBP2476242.1 hypothetical protein [Crossiella equi]
MSAETERKPKTSLFMLVVAVLGLGFAAFALTDGWIWEAVDPRWALAGLALLIGLGLLGASLRPRR